MSKYDDIFLSTETIQDFIDKNNDAYEKRNDWYKSAAGPRKC